MMKKRESNGHRCVSWDGDEKGKVSLTLIMNLVEPTRRYALWVRIKNEDVSVFAKRIYYYVIDVIQYFDVVIIEEIFKRSIFLAIQTQINNNNFKYSIFSQHSINLPMICHYTIIIRNLPTKEQATFYFFL
jgi:hypothetical protein